MCRIRNSLGPARTRTSLICNCSLLVRVSRIRGRLTHAEATAATSSAPRSPLTTTKPCSANMAAVFSRSNTGDASGTTSLDATQNRLAAVARANSVTMMCERPPTRPVVVGPPEEKTPRELLEQVGLTRNNAECCSFVCGYVVCCVFVLVLVFFCDGAFPFNFGFF